MKFLALLFLASISATAQTLVDSPGSVAKPEPFLSNRVNRVLIGSDLGIRLNDAYSTWKGRKSNSRSFTQCKGNGVVYANGQAQNCWQVSILGGDFLPPLMQNHLPVMIAYGFAVNATVSYASSLLWKHGHKRLARIPLLVDMAGDGYEGIGNYRYRKDWK